MNNKNNLMKNLELLHEADMNSHILKNPIGFAWQSGKIMVY